MLASGLPTLGVGLTYHSGIAPVLEAHRNALGVVEIEPQTLWFLARQAPERYRVDETQLASIAALPFPKLVHSVGFPVGGTHPPGHEALSILRRTVEALRVPWMSEHLSFNRAGPASRSFNTGFLLPPRQTWAGVAAAVASIRMLADEMSVPLAVETGVNYLGPRPDELPDGAFVGEVAERADCLILLDLHNLWTNERNGRQTTADFIAQLPLERVVEVHLAGGFERNGYWLDSHSGSIPEPLVSLAGSMLPLLGNLRALIFELFPAYLPSYGLAGVASQLRVLQDLWNGTRVASRQRPAERVPALPRMDAAVSDLPAEWENDLGALVVGKGSDTALADGLETDPGLDVFRELLGDFRRSMVASSYTLTTRLLMLTVGEERLEALFRAYWAERTPELFASAEGAGFVRFIELQGLDVPWLADVIAFERARLAAVIDRTTSLVSFDADPLRLLAALARGELPRDVVSGRYEVEIRADEVGDDSVLDALHAQPAPH